MRIEITTYVTNGGNDVSDSVLLWEDLDLDISDFDLLDQQSTIAEWWEETMGTTCACYGEDEDEDFLGFALTDGYADRESAEADCYKLMAEIKNQLT